jgi:very-short-patch-repair endonuclease/DNA polymerase III delta prime subunit
LYQQSKDETNVTSIKTSIEKARQDLIDLGLRNPMLNYRTRKTSGLEIVDSDVSAIYDVLVKQNKKMSIHANEERDKVGELYIDFVSFPSHYFNPLIKNFAYYYFLHSIEVNQLTEDDIDLYHNIDDVKVPKGSSYLQTDYSTKELQKRLLKTSYDANTYIEEQGVNALFIGLGMLHWFEDESSDSERLAPLILVPIAISRKTITSGFQIAYTDDGIGGNLSLQGKLQNDFESKITLPEFDETTDESDFDIQDYFKQIEQEISHKPQWSVEHNSAVIGFFAYSKYMMYMDLDVDKWGPDTFENHHILSKLLGDGFSTQFGVQVDNYTRDEIDEYLSQENNFHVMDADSSQAQAILAAKQGNDLVIQGPPGTGKSQTIANIIAEFVGEAKTVLFVSEKMAALEVVKRRLDAIGIGDLCLALHSYKTNKRSVLDELERTLKLGEVPENSFEEQLTDFVSIRDFLTKYTDAVNTPINDSGITPHQAFGRLLNLRSNLAQTDLPTWTDKSANTWSQKEYKSKYEAIEDVQQILKTTGQPKLHPFWGANIEVVTPSITDNVVRLAKSALAHLDEIQSSTEELTTILDIGSPDTVTQISTLCEVTNNLMKLTLNTDIAWESSDWINLETEIEDLINTGAELREIHERYENRIIPQGWQQDLFEIRTVIKNNAESFLRFVKPSYRKAISTLRGVFVEDAPKDAESQLKIIDDIMRAQTLSEEIEQKSSLGKKLFKALWLQDSSNWGMLRQYASTLGQFHRGVKDKVFPIDALQNMRNLDDTKSVKRIISQLIEIVEKYDNDIQSVIELIVLDEPKRFGQSNSYKKQPLSDQRVMIEAWYNNIETINDMATFNQRCRQLRDVGLGSIIEVIETWKNAQQYLSTFFERVYLDQLVDYAITQREPLARFDRESHERRLHQFRNLDELIFQSNRYQIMKQHYDSLHSKSMSSGQIAILRREFEKKRRHKPIRRLIRETATAIQAIKPVFMMSPMSISTYLEPSVIDFDLVVFDEASQIRPSEALGAILRGKQVIVVGDSRQLPPTSFFDSSSDVDDEDALTSHTESILGLFSAQSAKEQMLRWHYRSLHESLIATSNFEFYDNRLFIFPSPAQMSEESIGLKFRYLPRTFYVTGRSHNPGEAKEVALAVIKHAKEHPDLTLGVAAFSNSQTQTIRDELELLRRQHPETEPFFSAHPDEPFFVKNLENVQGDERDVIFISIGYGKQADGRLSLNFGPLNRDGGERRLNVLITRAKIRCEIFTNLQHPDIDLSRTSSKGISALKRYLKFAETGELELAEAAKRDFDSPFEQAVAEHLESEGYVVHNQIGTAGFFIDLAIVDPKRPGRYLLGIECDGATYHHSASARERDRLRQAILESKGWIIHRIWSTDWFKNPMRELQKVNEAVDNAKASADITYTPSKNSQAEVVINRQINETIYEDSEPHVKLVSYEMAELEQFDYATIDDVPNHVIRQLTLSLVQIESPIHKADAIKRVANALGFGRAGKNIQDRLSQNIRQMAKAGDIEDSSDFLFIPAGNVIGRDRSNLDNRDIEKVSTQEIAVVIELVVKHTIGISPDELIQTTCNSLGFARVSRNAKQLISQVIDNLIAEGKLKIENESVFLNKTSQKFV